MNRLLLVCALFAGQIYAQEERENYERIYVEAGTYSPLGNLSRLVAPSFNAGLWFNTKVTATESYDIGFNLYFPTARKPYNYHENDTLFLMKAKDVSGMIGARYNFTYALSVKNKVSLDIFPSIGYGFFMHDLRTLDAETMEVQRGFKKSQKALSTIHLGQGIRLNYDNIGISAQYQFTPYSLLYKEIGSDFGSHSLIFSVVYRQ